MKFVKVESFLKFCLIYVFVELIDIVKKICLDFLFISKFLFIQVIY